MNQELSGHPSLTAQFRAAISSNVADGIERGYLPYCYLRQISPHSLLVNERGAKVKSIHPL